MDNDDELDSQMCEKLYDAIVKYDADLSCCDIEEIDDASSVVHKMGPNSEEDYVIVMDDDILEVHSGFVWNKLFKKEIIDKNEIKFLEDNYSDDQAFSIEYMLNSKKLVYLNNYVGYFWNRRNESLSNSKELKNIEPLLSGYEYMLNLLVEKNKFHLVHIISNPGTFYLLFQTGLLKSNDDKKYFLEKVYDFEEKCDFKVELDNPFFSFINSFVLKRKFSTAALLLSLYFKPYSSSLFIKVYRKLRM